MQLVKKFGNADENPASSPSPQSPYMDSKGSESVVEAKNGPSS